MMLFALGVAVGLIGITAIIGVASIIRADSDASRAVISDLLFFAAIGVFVPIAALMRSAVTFDVALLASILGILGTLALGQMLTRGRR